jgi:glucan-binding YG repeat protein
LNGKDEWILLVDYFGKGGYYPYDIKDFSNPVYTDLKGGTYSLPSKPRHGTVMPITTEEYKNIMSAYGDLTGDLSALPDVVMQGDDGSVFPTSLKLGTTGIPETQKDYDIDWSITKDTFAKVGLVTVTGTIKSVPTKTINKQVLVVHRNTRYFVDSATDITNQQSIYYNSLASKTSLLNSKPDQAYDGTWGHTAYDGSMGTSNLGINNSGFYGKNDGSVNITYKVTLNSGKYALDSMQYEWWSGPRATEVHALYTDRNGINQDVTLGKSTVSSNSRIGMTSGEFTIDKDNTEVTIIFKRVSGDGGVVSYFAIAESQIVTAVDVISDMNVANGTIVSSIGLPTNVNVTVDNLRTTSAAVTWDNGNPNYDGNTEGNYKFTGTLTLANGIKNLNNLKAAVNVRVKALNETPTTIATAVELRKDDNNLIAILKNENGSKFTTDAAVKYEWYRDNELVKNKNSATYNLSDIDKGTSIKVKVPQYGLKSESINIPNNSTDKPTPIDKVTPVKANIKGTEIVDDTLEAQLLSENGVEFTTSAAVTYKWYRLSSKDAQNGESVGTDKGYKLIDIDEGKYIKLVATCEGKTFDDITSIISKKSSSSSNHHKHKSSSSSTSTTTSEADDIAVSNTETSKLSNNESTTIINGWKNNNDNNWICNENGKPVSGWKQIDGAWYLMDSTGIMQTGWRQANDIWYFLKYNGVMATGWVQINGKWYYLYSNGAMATNTVIDSYRLDETGAWVN